MPEWHQLWTSAGFGFFTSDTNFDTNGKKALLASNGKLALLNLSTINLGVSYGATADWSLNAELRYVFDSLKLVDGGTVLSGSGLPDAVAAMKWRLNDGASPLVIELGARFPFKGESYTANELAFGNGNTDLFLRVHAGHREGIVLVYLSPGLLARFGGYASAATANGGLELHFARGYFGVFGDFAFPFMKSHLLDSSDTSHDAPGSGGSYALLAGSPMGLAAGANFGLVFSPSVRLDVRASRSLLGERFPEFFSVNGALRVAFDFDGSNDARANSPRRVYPKLPPPDDN
jgi:hypothetical protein